MTLAETQLEPIPSYAPFADLDARTTGAVAVPGDEAYDALVSPWNVAIQVRPPLTCIRTGNLTLTSR